MRQLLTLLLIALILSFQIINAEEKTDSETKPTLTNLTLSFGKEFLYYSEKEPDTKTDSRAMCKNEILRFNASAKLFYSWVIGVKGVLPLSINKTTEKWDSLGYSDTYQENSLTYEWTRYDAYFGYSFYHSPQHLNYIVYGGYRQSDSEFKRVEFVVLGVPQSTVSTEEVESKWMLIGLKGEGIIKEKLPDYQYRDKKDEPPIRWKWGWGIEAGIPLNVRTTNSITPDIVFKNRGGYSFEGQGWLDYIIPKSAGLVALQTQLHFGQLHWTGSSWEDTIYGTTKWPKNDTLYFGLDLGLNWRF
ncbi:MAG: hypothetical protein HY811_03910 [Planctomycetes bacterium]|nr:hypothetical protein [Planctomycetota bacterium]